MRMITPTSSGMTTRSSRTEDARIQVYGGVAANHRPGAGNPVDRLPQALHPGLGLGGCGSTGQHHGHERPAAADGGRQHLGHSGPGAPRRR